MVINSIIYKKLNIDKYDWFPPWVLDKHTVLVPYLEKISNTKMLKLELSNNCVLFAKHEGENPDNSVKSRVALAMLWDVLKDYQGKNLDNLTILEYSGGLLSIALAELADMLNIRCVLVLLKSSPPSLLSKLRNYNAKVILVDPKLGFIGVVRKALSLQEEHPNWTLLYQHKRLANLAMHFHYTANEIIEQMDGYKPNAWVASIGTGGSLIGVYLRLIQINPTIKLYATSPAEMPYGTTCKPNQKPKFSGSGGFGYGKKQYFVEKYEAQIEKHLHVNYNDSKNAMGKFFKSYGIKIGSSAAANWKACIEVANELPPCSVLATIFPSSGFVEEWIDIEQQNLYEG